MTEQQLIDRVKNVVHIQLGVSKENIKLDSNLIDDLAADTLDVVELILAIEEEFDISIPEDDSESIKTVGDLVNYVHDHHFRR